MISEAAGFVATYDDFLFFDKNQNFIKNTQKYELIGDNMFAIDTLLMTFWR